MTDQIPLFVEDYYEALAATVAALGGFKRVGAELRPELPADHAGRWLADCCNHARDHELKPQQLGLLRKKARAAGVHVLAAFEMREAGYAEPVALRREDEEARVNSELATTVNRLEGLMAELKRVRTMP